MVNARGSMMFQTASKFFTLLGGVAVAGALSVAAPAQAATDDDDPYGDVPAAAAKADQNDAGFANLFASLQRLDGVTKASAYIPSGRPVSKLSLTSNFGVRSDPFNGGARMHKGIDIPGPVGTPIYATADGTIERANWFSSYGNYIQIDHGNAIETRFGHLSRIVVSDGQKVHKGDLIGYVGSTGRSTGPHLHYEVRIAGKPVDPRPFMVETEAQETFRLAMGPGGIGGGDEDE